MFHKWFKIRRKLFYRFHGENAYSIHSPHVYNYYTTSYMPAICSGHFHVIEEFQKWCRKNFPGCIFVNYDLADTDDLERLKNDNNRNIKHENDDNVIVTYLNINESPATLQLWNQEMDTKNAGLSIETYYFGAIFHEEWFAKQKITLRN